MRVELEHLRVGPLGTDQVAGRLVEDTCGAQEQRLLHFERLGVFSAETLGGHVERLGDGGGIGAVLDRLLESVGGVDVVGAGDQQIDELRELLLGEVATCRPQRGRCPPERLELVDDGRRVLRALSGLLGEEREDELVDVGRDPAARRLRARGLGGRRDVSEGGVGRRLERKHWLAGEQLVHHRPEGVEVGRRVRAMAAHLLRRDRLGRAEDREHPGVPVRDGRALPQAVGAEVDERDVGTAVTVPDEDVLELEIAVRDARPVKRGERLQDPAEDRPRVADVHGAGAREPCAERLGVDEVVAQPVRSVVFARFEPAG